MAGPGAVRLSKDEIYFQRLLHRTKKRCVGELTPNVYKLKASIDLMEALFSKLQDDKAIDNEVLMQYGRDVQQLKILVEAERKKTAEDLLRSIEALPRVSPSTDLRRRRRVQSSGIERSEADMKDEDEEEDVGQTCSLIKERAKQIYVADLRKQLLGSATKESVVGPDGDIFSDAYIVKQEALHGDLAEELLYLTKSLKMNFQTAGDVIRKDNETLSTMQKVAEKNTESLEFESKRLAHYAYKSWINCIMAAVVVLVVWTFLVMVLIIKFNRKY